jgi:hypothetical protein
MVRTVEMHRKWLKAPNYRKAYEALEEEFVLAVAGGSGWIAPADKLRAARRNEIERE